MSELEGFSYAVFAVYAATSVGLTAAASKLGVPGRGGLRRSMAFGLFLAAGLWPLLRALNFSPDPASVDAVRDRLDGQAGDIVGHLLLAAGALTAMMAEVHILTRARSPDVRLEPTMARSLVPVGRIVLLAGLFLVFPDVVQAALCFIAAALVFATRADTIAPKAC